MTLTLAEFMDCVYRGRLVARGNVGNKSVGFPHSHEDPNGGGEPKQCSTNGLAVDSHIPTGMQERNKVHPELERLLKVAKVRRRAKWALDDLAHRWGWEAALMVADHGMTAGDAKEAATKKLLNREFGAPL